LRSERSRIGAATALVGKLELERRRERLGARDVKSSGIDSASAHRDPER